MLKPKREKKNTVISVESKLFTISEIEKSLENTAGKRSQQSDVSQAEKQHPDEFAQL